MSTISGPANGEPTIGSDQKLGERPVCALPPAAPTPPITASAAKLPATNTADASKPDNSNLPRYFYTQKEFWGGTSLSYVIYTALALIPITGFLGLDHMYMRSPGTGFLKFIVNFLTLGFWYFYDVIQAVTDKDDVMKFGVSMPLYGPSGIAAGSFGTDEEPVRDSNGGAGSFLLFSAMSFFIPFGFEYLVAGDITGFICKFVGTLLIIGFVYGLINNMKLINHPERVMCSGLPRYAPFTWVGVDPTFETPSFRNTAAADNCPAGEGAVGGWFGGIFSNLFTRVPILKDVYQSFVGVQEAAGVIAKRAGKTLGTVTKLAASAAATPAVLTEFGAKVASEAGEGGIAGAAMAAAAGPQAPAGAAGAAQGISVMNGTTQSGGGTSPESSSNTIIGFTLALVFLGAFFVKGKDAVMALSDRREELPPALGDYIIRNKNEFPPTPPESGVF